MKWLHITCELQWVTLGAVDVDIGANPSAEGGEEEEGVDDQAVKVVDIVDTFRLQVGYFFLYCILWVSNFNIFVILGLMEMHLQEQAAFDKKQFIGYIKKYIKLLTAKLEGEELEVFKKHIEGAIKFLLGKLKDLQL